MLVLKCKELLFRSQSLFVVGFYTPICVSTTLPYTFGNISCKIDTARASDFFFLHIITLFNVQLRQVYCSKIQIQRLRSIEQPIPTGTQSTCSATMHW